MGDPKRSRKQYKTPVRPWVLSRIEEEKKLTIEYGFANKKEIWKISTMMSDFKTRGKTLIPMVGEKGNIERQKLISKLNRMGILNETATIEDVLSLSLRDFADRRLQSIVVRKGLARTVKQARQMITHQHVKVNDKKLTAPGYIVLREEENAITFAQHSKFIDEKHPERIVVKKGSKITQAPVVEEPVKEETTETEAKND